MTQVRRPNRRLALVFYVLLGALATLLVLRGSGVLAARYSIPDYDHSSASSKTALPPDVPATLAWGERLDVSLAFRIDSRLIDEKVDAGAIVGGLFQTADGELGVRMELALANGPFNNWGVSIVGRHYDLGPLPALDRWHRLQLVFDDLSATLTLDGVRLLRLDEYSDSFLLNAIRAGQGYSADRTFPGAIRQFDVTLTRFDRITAHASLLVASLLLITLVLWLLDACAVANGPRAAWLDLAPARWAGGLAYVTYFLWIKRHYATVAPTEMLWDIAWVATVLVALQALLAAMPGNRARKLTLVAAGAVNYAVLVTLTAGAIYFRHRGEGTEFGLTFDEIGVLHQSNLMEALNFFTSAFSLAEKTQILGLPAVSSAALYLACRVPLPCRRSRSVLVAGLAGAFAIPQPLMTSSGIAATVYGGWQQYEGSARSFSEYRASRAGARSLQATKPESGETYVLVIGESANRDHYSAYGYFRPTTPWLTRVKDAPGSILFDNAYASYVHTVPALMQALTAANQYNSASTLTTPTLIEVFGAAGFNTIWLSEQVLSWADSPLHTLAAESAQVIQVRSPGVIAGKFQEVLRTLDRSQNNLVVVHLMGSHADYRNRVPADYAVEFSSSPDDLGDLAHDVDFVHDVLGPYDASIHFTDTQLAAIDDALRKFGPDRHVLFYAADHGEDVIGRRFHDAVRFSFSMARIPMFIRCSAEWINAYPARYEQLRQHAHRLFSLDLLYDAMIGIANIDTAAASRDLDVGNQAYRLSGDMALTMNGPPDALSGLYANVPVRALQADPYETARRHIGELNRSHPDRFLANWADSLARATEADSLGFAGVEVNIAVPSLKIGHAPEIVHARTLEEYLQLPSIRSKARLWFDLKLAPGRRLSEAVDALETLAQRFDLKRRVILESPERGLGAFAARGWQTSFYFIPERWPGCLADDRAKQRCARQIADIVRDEELSAVSFDARYYSFVNELVAPLLPKRVVFHTFGGAIPSPFEPQFHQQLGALAEFRDPRVRTLLLETSQRFFEGKTAPRPAR